MTETRKLITVYFMGEAFYVPEGSTIISALEFAGFQLKRGVGCREGFCGACATLYREANDYRLQGGLACQTVVKDGMTLSQIPFVPAQKPAYALEALEPTVQTFMKLFPSIFRCVACNTCTKACPQEIRVMDYVQALKRGDISRAADLSFDCVRCGLCALRCPAEIVQYNAAMLAQRLFGRYLAKRSREVDARIQEIAAGTFDRDLDNLMNANRETLTTQYYQRDIDIS